MTRFTAVNERPILFSGPMVRALLDGRKMQTRCVVQVRGGHYRGLPSNVSGERDSKGRWWMEPTGWTTCPYGQPGDRLWVRETWCHEWDQKNERWFDPPRALYRADGRDVVHVDDVSRSPWTPSIHMPRWASRITLEITSVRVERLQDITEADAQAEGLKRISKDGTTWKWGISDRDGLPGTDDDGMPWHDWSVDARRPFQKIWDSRHRGKPRCLWEINPWVWVIQHHITMSLNLASHEDPAAANDGSRTR